MINTYEGLLKWLLPKLIASRSRQVANYYLYNKITTLQFVYTCSDVINREDSLRLMFIGDEPYGKVPDNPYVVSPLVEDDQLTPFHMHQNAYGMQLLANSGDQKINPNFLCFICKVMKEMFPKTVPDPKLQKKLLDAMYHFKASNPVVLDSKKMPHKGDMVSGMSMCDSIHIGSDKHQAMEVVEHVLHITTNVGFHHTFTKLWGLTRASEVWEAMTEAQTNKVFDISEYNTMRLTSWMTDEAYVRILIQVHVSTL